MDLVDEQHIAVLELGEDGGEIPRPFERRARGDVQMAAHLGRDDARHGGLAEPGRTGEQEMVGGLVPATSGFEDDREVFLQLPLTDEVVQAPRAQTVLLDLLELVHGLRRGELRGLVDEFLTHAWLPRLSGRPGAAPRRRPRRAVPGGPRGSPPARSPNR